VCAFVKGEGADPAYAMPGWIEPALDRLGLVDGRSRHERGFRGCESRSPGGRRRLAAGDGAVHGGAGHAEQVAEFGGAYSDSPVCDQKPSRESAS